MPTITSKLITKVAGVDWYTPFEVTIDDSDLDYNKGPYQVVWSAVDNNKHSVDKVKWPNGTTVSLPLQEGDSLIKYFTLATEDFNGLAMPITFSVQIQDKVGNSQASTTALSIDFKKLKTSQPFTGSSYSVIAGGNFALAPEVLTLTTKVLDLTNKPVANMQVNFDLADIELDPNTLGLTFLVGTEQTLEPPVVLTNAAGIAEIKVAVKTTHFLGFRSTVIGSTDDGLHDCAFVHIGDYIEINPSPAITLNNDHYVIEPGSREMLVSLYPLKLPAHDDKIFVVVNNQFIQPVVQGIDFSSEFYVPLSALNQKEDTESNIAVYYVQNGSGVVTASKNTKFGVTGSYNNAPDPSITNRPLDPPKLKPTLPVGKTVTYDYLYITPTIPGITVTIPGLQPDSNCIGKTLNVVFYLNGYYYDTFIPRHGTSTLSGKIGSITPQDVTLPIANALGYDASESGVKDNFYVEYFYSDGGKPISYSKYIKYSINTGRP